MADIKKIITEQINKLKPDPVALAELTKRSKDFVDSLQKEFTKAKIDAEVFLGGSFAKGTLLKADNYDIDVFVRFDKKYENISDKLEVALGKLNTGLNTNIERVHGSRDYFIFRIEGMAGYFEVIPVTKISKPTEEKNVTDLTYFHAPYIKKRIKGLEDQVRIAKKFLKAQEVYGAETYVKGFSGYTVELLIIKYKTLLNMLKELSKVTTDKRLVIDLEEKYKNPHEVFIQINEAKLHSPIILIDPTYKERNALAALSIDTFKKFQESARAFLKNPSHTYFENKSLDIEKIKEKAKNKKLDFVQIHLSTDKQAGDIAGTKLKKFFEVILREIKKNFILKDSYFKYSGGNTSESYIMAKPKKELVRIGPPLIMKKEVQSFKNKHANTYEKNKHVHAKLKIDFSLKDFLDSYKGGNKTLMKQMHITDFNVKN
jgi:tRNA nucleotidyltransferase (CCA-adding enzyme)